MSTKTSVKKNFALTSAAQILGNMLTLITSPYISRILGAEGIGIYSYNSSIAAYFVSFAMLGLNNYGNRTIAKVKGDKNQLSKMFCEIYVMQLGFAVLVSGIYLIYVISASVSVVAAILFFYVASSAIDINWFFYGMELFKMTVTRNLVVRVLSVLCVFIFVKSESDVYLYVMIITASTVVSHLALWPYLKRYIILRPVGIRDICSHVKPNIILFIPAVAVSIYKLMDKVMLGTMSSMTQAGYYENSEKLIQIPIVLVTSLGTVMLPRMSNLVEMKAHDSEDRYMRKSFGLVMFLSTSMSFGIMAVADTFVPVYYGAGYEECIGLLQILMPCCIFIAFANVIRTQLLIPKQMDKIYIQSVSLGAVMNVVLNLFWIGRFQAFGVCLATLITEFSVCLYQAIKVRSIIDIRKYVLISVPFFMAGIIMYVVVLNLHFPEISQVAELIIRVLIGCVIYIVACSLLNLKHIYRFCRCR